MVVEDLRICTFKMAEDLERRFCFEVVTPMRSSMLQADSEALRKTWMTYLEGGIARALRISASNKVRGRKRGGRRERGRVWGSRRRVWGRDRGERGELRRGVRSGVREKEVGKREVQKKRGNKRSEGWRGNLRKQFKQVCTKPRVLQLNLHTKDTFGTEPLSFFSECLVIGGLTVSPT